MIQRIFYSATLALSLLSEVSATNKYSLVDNYEGVNFFEMFDFYTVSTSIKWQQGSI
jgi:hypothetical protein